MVGVPAFEPNRERQAARNTSSSRSFSTANGQYCIGCSCQRYHCRLHADVQPGNANLVSEQAASSPDVGDSPWQAGQAAGILFSTLYLAMEWVLQAHPANRSPVH